MSKTPKRYFKTTRNDGPTMEMWGRTVDGINKYTKAAAKLQRSLRARYGALQLYEIRDAENMCVTSVYFRDHHENPDPALWAAYGGKNDGTYRPRRKPRRKTEAEALQKLKQEFYVKGPSLAKEISELFGCGMRSFHGRYMSTPGGREINDKTVIIIIPEKDTRVGGKKTSNPIPNIPDDVEEIKEWEYLKLVAEQEEAEAKAKETANV